MEENGEALGLGFGEFGGEVDASAEGEEVEEEGDYEEESGDGPPFEVGLRSLGGGRFGGGGGGEGVHPRVELGSMGWDVDGGDSRLEGGEVHGDVEMKEKEKEKKRNM